jgi:uncharacterized protein YutE (UPF0331/DUF86 family)
MSPGKLDFETVRRDLLALDQTLAHLQRHAGRTVEILREDLDERWAVERGLQLCVQNVLNIATHLGDAAGRGSADFTPLIEQLRQLGVISSGLATRLRPLMGFRDALVFGYLRVDLDRVHTVLNHHLDQMREFARDVDRYLAASAVS